MKVMVALELIIKDLQVRISIAKAQLIRDETGEEKLSLLAKSSAENSLELHQPLIAKYKKMLKELEKFEKLDCYEHRRLRAAIQRKKYYKFNKIQNRDAVKKIKFRENDEIIESATIIDELPEEFVFNKTELFEIASQNLENYLGFDKNAPKELQRIQDEFNNLIKRFTDENIKSLELLNYMIPIVIFHFSVFKKNMIEFNFGDQDMDFFPKYHDWWIEELWESHLSYFALCEWKNSITTSCVENDYKKAWEIIFNNWIFIKTLINEKSQLAFEYQYIFDSLINKYVGLESELNIDMIGYKKNELQKSLKDKKLSPLKSSHQLITNYINYKLSNNKVVTK